MDKRIKHTWSLDWVNKSPRPGDFMNKRRSELENNHGGKWVWYTAHGQCICLPTIEFSYVVDKRDHDVVNSIRKVIDQAKKPLSMIDLFHVPIEASLEEISRICGYLIKVEKYKFDTCRTGDAVAIKKGA